MKYIERPKGTTLSIETSEHHQFPGITVCAAEKSTQWNHNLLNNCGVKG